jgi:hypothetical protein
VNRGSTVYLFPAERDETDGNLVKAGLVCGATRQGVLEVLVGAET